MEVDWVVVKTFELFLERLIDEDDCYEHGETFLCKASDETHEGAQIERDHDEEEETHPHADPETELQIVPSVVAGN